MIGKGLGCSARPNYHFGRRVQNRRTFHNNVGANSENNFPIVASGGKGDLFSFRLCYKKMENDNNDGAAKEKILTPPCWRGLVAWRQGWRTLTSWGQRHPCRRRGWGITLFYLLETKFVSVASHYSPLNPQGGLSFLNCCDKTAHANNKPYLNCLHLNAISRHPCRIVRGWNNR